MHPFRFPLLAAMTLGCPIAGLAQTAVIDQSGDGHFAEVVQGGSFDQRVSVQQIGSATIVDVTQEAPDAEADLSLSGENLTATLHQDGEAESGLALTMEGSDGIVDALQSGDPGGSNFATVWQAGSGNSASLSQYASAGMPNSIRLIQDGTANVAILAQTGEGNTLDLSQLGADNFAAIDQIGSGLGLGLIQNGGASITVTQTGSP